ncbi:hypothetical protein [Agromyces sp. NPDC049794]|uniref:hypothetical protein n=1 Tax=Agromyces sp. NPDC049794 TaxID=3154362 RepID=UPI0033E80A84
MTAVRVSASPRPANRNWALWPLTFLGFPLGGLPAIALGGVEDVFTALAGGAAAGAVIGAAQWLALRRIVPRLSWMWLPATAAGLALGLAAGSAAVGYTTAGPDLLLQGLLTGVGVGVAQAGVLGRSLGVVPGLVWTVAALALWPLGWAITQAFGVAVENRYAVFGATGAIAYTGLSGLVLWALVRRF